MSLAGTTAIVGGYVAGPRRTEMSQKHEDGRQSSEARQPERSDPTIGQSPFSKPKMEEIGKPLLPWRRKKSVDER